MSYHIFRTDNSDSRTDCHPSIPSAPKSSSYCDPLPRNESNRVPLATAPPSIPSRSNSTPTQLASPSPASPQVKRKKENNAFIVYSPDQPAARKKRKRALTHLEKLESILEHIQSLGWSFSDYMFYSSEWKDFSRGTTHSQAVDVSTIQMWSTSEPTYSEINHIRACLTSFAAQICIEHAVKQAKNAVKPHNGLQVRISAKGESGSYSNSLHSDWADIGTDTVSRVGDIFRTHEPFLYDFLSCVASGEVSIDGNLVRKTRPVDTVVTHSIATLNFTLNRFANWLPVARGIFYFSISAPVDTFAYESRTGTMPAYTTVYRVLQALGKEEACLTRSSAGSNPSQWGKVFFDNTQRYLRQRDQLRL
ncbi:hypothetical protein FB446DRAFT_793893 [Lentinula raphanica]|nr:hypothetical protein FB446DRAFT_793893 [Lentinula raphanica]